MTIFKYFIDEFTNKKDAIVDELIKIVDAISPGKLKSDLNQTCIGLGAFTAFKKSLIYCRIELFERPFTH